MRIHISRNILLVLVVCIVAVGAYLRLHRIADYLTFLGDEGRDVLIVKRMIVDHDFVLLGPTASVGGFFLGPMYYYFMAPFLWLFQLNPVGPAVMVALFGIATIFLVYRVGSKFFHPVVGIIASSLYALSPVIIAYSRSSWNPNLVPFFSLLLIYLLWHYAMHRKVKALFFIGLVWGVGIQFHYLFSFLIIFSILWIFFIERSVRAVQKTGIMVLSSAITFSPFILFEIRHSFPNTRSLFKFFVTGNETGFTLSNFIKIIGDVSFRSIGRLLFRMPNYELWNGFPDWQINLLEVLIRTTLWVSVLLLLLMSLTKLRHMPKKIAKLLSTSFPLERNQWYGIVLLITWFCFSIFLFGFYRRGIYDYYFGIFYAFPFLAIGVIFWQLMRSKAGLVIALLLWSGLLYFNWQGRPFVYPPNKQMQQTKNIADAVLEMAQGKPYNFALITATNSDHAYRYFLEISGKKPVPIDQLIADPERKTVTDQLIAICENVDCHPLGNSQWEVAGFGRAEITAERQVFPVKIVRLVHYTEKP